MKTTKYEETNNLIEKELTKEKFIAWLEYHNPEEVISEKGYNCSTCPLAQYTSTFLHVNFTVGRYGLYSCNPEEFQDVMFRGNDQWANTFVTEIDKISGYDTIVDHTAEAKKITCAQCLEVLKK